MPTDPGPYLNFKLNDTFDIERFLEKNYFGLTIAPRTIEDALRRGHLEFYQVGMKRYTTPMLIDKWLQSRLTSADTHAAARR
ncbi:hypothetical protein ONA92_17270 [Mycobacteroides salmoniphilum]|uniref:hypothetical protein n=1 Tax=Mycobacteroides salmoniphilum TaxID=404941 RepID=UPI003565341C